MSNMTDVLSETGTALPSPQPGFTHGFWWCPCCHRFIFLCSVSCFVGACPLSCVPNVASVSGLSFLDCCFGFL